MNGQPLREHLQAVQERTGQIPQTLLDAPALPEGAEHLWRDFTSLRATAGSNGFGPMRITFGEIDAYQRLGGFEFEPWEIGALQRADSAFMAAWAKSAKEKRGD